MKKALALIIWGITSLSLYAQNSSYEKYPILSALLETPRVGEGILMGQGSHFTMNWQSVLNDQFLQLDFQNSRKSPNSEDIVFKATAFYKIVNDSSVVGNWFDNRGITFPLSGTVEENKMTIYWGSEETEKGKTTYQYSPENDQITVVDFVWYNETYAKFGTAVYTKVQIDNH